MVFRADWFKITDAIESCEKYHVPGCRDSVLWKDIDGDDCMAYVDKDVCSNGILSVRVSDLMSGCSGNRPCESGGKLASDACCVCGGGSMSAFCDTEVPRKCAEALYFSHNCEMDKLGLLGAECSDERYAACYTRECSKVPFSTGSSLSGNMSCNVGSGTTSTTPARLVLTSVIPSAKTGRIHISAALTFRGNSSLGRHATSEGKSENTCAKLGWKNAKKASEEVLFTDADGDINIYRQTASGIHVSLSKKGNRELQQQGLVRHFHYDNVTGLLDDSYGLLKIPADKKTLIISQLANLATVNGVPGLEMFANPALPCLATLTEVYGKQKNFASAKTLCIEKKARLCTYSEIIELNDFNEKKCPRQKTGYLWTSNTCVTPNGIRGNIAVARATVPPGTWLTLANEAERARAVCSGEDSGAFVACCGDSAVGFDDIVPDATQTLLGQYDLGTSRLILVAKRWVADTSNSRGNIFLPWGVPDRVPASLSASFDRGNLSLQGSHSLCPGGTFSFTVREMGGGVGKKYSFLQMGECRCHDGSRPASADINRSNHSKNSDKELNTKDCQRSCDANPACTAITVAISEYKSIGVCRLHFRQNTPQMRNDNGDDYLDVKVRTGTNNNRKCEILRAKELSAYPSAQCYLKEARPIYGRQRIDLDQSTGRQQTMLSCFDEMCHAALSACRWDDACTELLTCIANEMCKDMSCLRKCELAINQKFASIEGETRFTSAEFRDLLTCANAHHCTKVRSENTPDDVDVDVMANYIRFAYPLQATEMVLAAVKTIAAESSSTNSAATPINNGGRSNSQQNKFLLGLFDDFAAVTGVSRDRFRYVRDFYDSDHGPSVIVEVDVFTGSAETVGMNESFNFDETVDGETLFNLIKWMARNPKSLLYQPPRVWTPHTYSNGEVILLEHRGHEEDEAAGRHWISISSYKGAGLDTETITSIVLGAFLGAIAMLGIVLAFIRHRRNAFLQHVVGVRVTENKNCSDANSGGDAAEMEMLNTSYAWSETGAFNRNRLQWRQGSGYNESSSSEDDELETHSHAS